MLALLGQLISLVLPALQFCTEDQAENIGLFFLYLFKQLQKLSASSDSQKVDNLAKFVLPSFTKRISAQLNACIQSTSSMKCRCALIFLNIVISEFPGQLDCARAIQLNLNTKLAKLGSDSEDIKTLCSRLSEKIKQKVAVMEGQIAHQAF